MVNVYKKFEFEKEMENGYENIIGYMKNPELKEDWTGNEIYLTEWIEIEKFNLNTKMDYKLGKFYTDKVKFI